MSSISARRSSSRLVRYSEDSLVYTDFLSMYSTVNRLMRLWRFVVADKINVIEHCKDEIEKFLNGVTVDDLFKPKTWEKLTGFVRIIPDGDILPSRGQYN